jgi:hypothetical protein
VLAGAEVKSGIADARIETVGGTPPERSRWLQAETKNEARLFGPRGRRLIDLVSRRELSAPSVD